MLHVLQGPTVSIVEVASGRSPSRSHLQRVLPSWIKPWGRVKHVGAWPGWSPTWGYCRHCWAFFGGRAAFKFLFFMPTVYKYWWLVCGANHPISRLHVERGVQIKKVAGHSKAGHTPIQMFLLDHSWQQDGSFSRTHEFLTANAVFVWESFFIPKFNVKSKFNLEVLSAKIYQVIECTQLCHLLVYGQLYKSLGSIQRCS